MAIRDVFPGHDPRFFAPAWVADPEGSPAHLFWREGTDEVYLLERTDGLSAQFPEAQDPWQRYGQCYFLAPEAWAVPTDRKITRKQRNGDDV